MFGVQTCQTGWIGWTWHTLLSRRQEWHRELYINIFNILLTSLIFQSSWFWTIFVGGLADHCRHGAFRYGESSPNCIFQSFFQGTCFSPSKTLTAKGHFDTVIFLSQNHHLLIILFNNLPHGAAAFSTHPMPWHEALTNLISLHDLTTSRVASAQFFGSGQGGSVVETELRRSKTKSIPQNGVWMVGWLFPLT